MTSPPAPFLSLDFLYVPTPEVDAATGWYVGVLGARLEWKVRAMGTVVAALRVSTDGPLVLLAGHLHGQTPILVYLVADYAATVAGLETRGITSIEQLEIPTGHAPASGPKAANASPSTSSSALRRTLTSQAASTGDRDPSPPGNASAR